MNKFLTMTTVTLLACVSQASYLYWQVDTSDAPSISFDAARVVAIQTGSSSGETILSFADDEGDTLSGYSMVQAGVGAAINLDQLGDASSYSFYIELVNYNTSTETYDCVGRSTENATYASLVANKYIDTGDSVLPISSASVWHGGSFSVPEPTSAMLVMVGVGLLALKRRRV